MPSTRCPATGELASLLTGTARGAAAVGDGGGASDGGGDANFYESYAVSGTSRCCSRRPRTTARRRAVLRKTDIKSGWWKQVLGEAASGQTGADCRRRLGRENGRRGRRQHHHRLATHAATPPWRRLPAQAVRESTLVTGPVTRTVESLGGVVTATRWPAYPAGDRGRWRCCSARSCCGWCRVRLRSAKRWTYSDKSSRDSRVDMMRGLRHPVRGGATTWA